MKHSFSYTPDTINNPYDNVKVIVEIDSDDLTNVVRSMETYLKAVGFCFNGHLDIVEDENVCP